MSALAAELTAASTKSELRVPHHSANSFQGGITSPTHPTALFHRHIWPKVIVSVSKLYQTIMKSTLHGHATLTTSIPPDTIQMQR